MLKEVKFSFVSDGLTGKLKHIAGVYKWLDYPDSIFTTKGHYVYCRKIFFKFVNNLKLWNKNSNLKILHGS